MATHVRSFSKINLGLAIGPARADGFHGLTTMYQTLALRDVVTVAATRSPETSIVLTSNHPWVPGDNRNTAWKMVERCLERMGVTATVKIRIQKNLPVQGGMGAGSANAAAALMGLEKELGVALPGPERMELAASVGSDVPLFLLGGSVLGLGRGEQVYPLPDLPETICVMALPEVGVSTPQAFRDWDGLGGGGVDGGSPTDFGSGPTHRERQRRDEWGTGLSTGLGTDFAANSGGLTESTGRDTLSELSCALASTYAEPGTSGIFCKPGTQSTEYGIETQGRAEKKAGEFDQSIGQLQTDLAENTLLALVRTGIENDFEKVVFPIHPSLREIKRQLMGIRQNESANAGSGSLDGADSSGPALYAALSGSGSALFGLYRSMADAIAAQQRVQALGCKAVITHTLPRTAYWRTMFAG
ncbi:4-diphosphocytidyl-2-C-methyl-D-erythritol kinase [Granulicella aggregans]|uniref:4-diphosphocytidyl-2-C-methyl-D-erythritol kinase n=1 Tax=Granulicella aggregans TaxID=474949 RepID=A0A7W7ZDE3_9BACT|nr:4-(cytidine 5'-diphospho)-2-C-methyl-D-erythritol kinase [Granulicella aggregans]MBB5057311.1 4-diphosphocytidyl-2-C-methyl-D-erythritol kinase [Granulicella aggregans]